MKSVYPTPSDLQNLSDLFAVADSDPKGSVIMSSAFQALAALFDIAESDRGGSIVINRRKGKTQ